MQDLDGEFLENFQVLRRPRKYFFKFQQNSDGQEKRVYYSEFFFPREEKFYKMMQDLEGEFP